MMREDKETLYNLRYLLNKDLDMVELEIMNKIRNNKHCTEQIQERDEIMKQLKQLQDEINN